MCIRLAVAIVTVSVAAPALAQPYQIDWWNAGGGGGTSSDGLFSVSGSTGQLSSTTPMSGGIYSVSGGYWSGVDNTPTCRADFNRDGFLDFFDYDAFVECYETEVCGGSSADYNQDGFLDFFDYDDFVLAFEIGC